MTNETTLPELPEPFAEFKRDGFGRSVYLWTSELAAEIDHGTLLYTADQMHAYAQQATATLRAELEQCRADAERLDSRMIAITGRDEFGNPQRTIHYDVDLRAAIDAARGVK